MTTPAGLRRVRVTVQNPGPRVWDGKGGYTVPWTDAVPPSWLVRLTSSGGRNQERQTHDTVAVQAAHTVTGPWRSDVTTESRLVLADTGAVLNVLSVDMPDHRQTELVCAVAEVVL